MSTIQRVREIRNMPWLKVGMRVLHTHNGKKGTVTGASGGSGNIKVKMDGENYSGNYHPKWMMKYFDKDGNLIQEF